MSEHIISKRRKSSRIPWYAYMRKTSPRGHSVCTHGGWPDCLVNSFPLQPQTLVLLLPSTCTQRALFLKTFNISYLGVCVCVCVCSVFSFFPFFRIIISSFHLLPIKIGINGTCDKTKHTGISNNIYPVNKYIYCKQ